MAVSWLDEVMVKYNPIHRESFSLTENIIILERIHAPSWEIKWIFSHRNHNTD